MNILLMNPSQVEPHTGNRTTAERWARLLGELGHQVQVAHEWLGSSQTTHWDLLITLHARKSYPMLESFHRAYPEIPVIVGLTGTDIYQDIESSWEAKQTLAIASRLVVLQPLAVDALQERFRSRCRVIYQSATLTGGDESFGFAGSPQDRLAQGSRFVRRGELDADTPQFIASDELADGNVFRICVLAHLRAVKDPLRAAYAARDLPADSRVQVMHAGGVLDADLAREAEAEQRRNPRYVWLGDVTHERALHLLAGSHLLALTSLLEGGANVLSEAIAAGVSVLSTSIPGSIGILGPDYPGYFPAGDTRALCLSMQQAESNHDFYGELKQRIRDLQLLVDPQRERESWQALLAEVTRPLVTV